MGNVWMVRAGEGGYLIKDFGANGDVLGANGDVLEK